MRSEEKSIVEENACCLLSPNWRFGNYEQFINSNNQLTEIFYLPLDFRSRIEGFSIFRAQITNFLLRSNESSCTLF